MKLSVGYITAPSKAEAKQLIEALFEENLVACASLLPAMESYFMWKGNFEKTSEVAIIFKTREKNHDKIIALVDEIHPYECPCVVFWELEDGHPDFLKWVDRAC